MKPDLSFLNKTRVVAYLGVVAGTFLIMAVLVFAMIRLTRPPATNAARSEERHKNLRELQAANTDVLNNYAVLDPGKGVIRLPIARAMEIALQEWKNPASARTNLLGRSAIASAPPPKEPIKPSVLE